MKLEILQHVKPEHSAGDTLKFALRDCDNALANAFRRVMLAEVPTVSIDICTVLANTSVLFDEMIVHRLGLVPLDSSLVVDRLSFPRDCACGGSVGCHDCQIGGRLTVACPPDQHKRDVYAADLVFDDPNIRHVSSTEQGVWLLSLGRSQQIDIQFVIRKGIPKEHAKFMPVGTVSMQYEMDVRVFQSGFRHLSEKLRKDFVAKCPGKVFRFNDRDRTVEVEDSTRCIFCRDCLSMEPPYNNLIEPLVNVRQKQPQEGHYNFIFTVESTGVLPVMTIVLKALDILSRKLSIVGGALRAGPGGDAAALAALPTRPIGTATTAPRVVDQGMVAAQQALQHDDDNLQQFNY